MSVTYHTVVVRFGEHIAPPEGTVAAHQRVIEDYGYVWWGKLGTPLAQCKIEKMRKQRDDGTMTIFLLCGRVLTLAEVDDCSPNLTISELEAVPAYYRGKSEDAGTWFRLRSLTPLENRGIAKGLCVESSHQPLSEVITASMSPMFYVSIQPETLSELRR